MLTKRTKNDLRYILCKRITALKCKYQRTETRLVSMANDLLDGNGPRKIASNMLVWVGHAKIPGYTKRFTIKHHHSFRNVHDC